MPDHAPPRTERRTLIWWGRGDRDYSRNRIVRRALEGLGWRTVDFSPARDAPRRWWASRALPRDAAMVWVPCFRQRDIRGAARWARRTGARLVVDPLISVYDKQVHERGKLGAGSAGARRLLRWESELFALADTVIADTRAHADYFEKTHGVRGERLFVVPVSAEPGLFEPKPARASAGEPVEVLFYGSFIGLQDPETIVRAARLCPEARWSLLGEGPLRARCASLAASLPNVRFEPWMDYETLPDRIGQADILLGVFGASAKAGRVVPNKVYQALACARPVVTRATLPGAWPGTEGPGPPGVSGLQAVPPEDPAALAEAVRRWAARPALLPGLGRAARTTFDRYASPACVARALDQALDHLTPDRAPKAPR